MISERSSEGGERRRLPGAEGGSGSYQGGTGGDDIVHEEYTPAGHRLLVDEREDSGDIGRACRAVEPRLEAPTRFRR